MPRSRSFAPIIRRGPGDRGRLHATRRPRRRDLGANLGLVLVAALLAWFALIAVGDVLLAWIDAVLHAV